MKHLRVENAANRKLLIVEDEEDVALLLRDVLSVKGFHCLIEHQGENVVQRVIEDDPALVLLDIRLVGIDGYTVCRRLKRESKTQDVPVVFLSALNTEKDILEAQEAGGIYFIAKPFDIQFLVRKMEELIVQSTPNQVIQDEKSKIMYVQSESRSEVFQPDDALFALFASSDFEVNLVREPREALRTAQKTLPDLIILDLDNAHLSVESVADAIRRHRMTEDIPILVLSSASFKDIAPLKNITSINAVIPKPVPNDQWLPLLHKMCDEPALVAQA